MKISGIFFVGLVSILFCPLIVNANLPENTITFAQGHKKNVPLVFMNATHCHKSPCVIGQYGAIKFAPGLSATHDIKLSYLHDDQMMSFSLFQEGALFKEGLFDRLVNKQRNRNVFNLEQSLAAGQTDTVYLYGVLLHYQLEEGDLIVIDIINHKDAKDKHQCIFRFHRTGPIFDADVALINPIDYFAPNPNDTVKYASISIAVSTSVGWYMNPEKDYNFAQKFLGAWRFNIFTGLLRRHELTNIGGDNIVDARFDGFVGAGFTFVDFFIGGMGVNLVRSPHTVFPFVGVEVKHLYQFMKSIKKSTKKRWNKYQELVMSNE
ncbi:MAG: hypothetical protein ACD_62C00510G0004 [uncultured bacterium]|nr:MAG: hypothetical protein ACD_62C00510G0004 [uncultured bacterium]HLD45059.1 hypothetical protein [bacterium]